jgi:hypothetical protein
MKEDTARAKEGFNIEVILEGLKDRPERTY